MTGYLKGSLGAASTDSQTWDSINWSQLRKDVHRLQVRIAKATKEKRWGKVKALQRVLVTSWSARALAVKTVTSNRGKNTPGIDRVVWKKAKAKIQAIDNLKRRGYKSQPLRRTYIPKTNGRMRPLGIPTMKDRAMQALYAMALLPIAETKADPHSYGFRPKRCVADAIEQCHIVLAPRNRAHWILEGDIKACFDQIEHQWLIESIPMDSHVLRQWLKAGYMEKDAFFATEEGTPQGGIISPILANMALDGLQEMIMQVSPRGSKVNFIRYADDFICTASTKQLLEQTIKPAIEEFLGKRGLTLSQEKTLVTHIDKGFDFLGFNIRKYDRKLLIKPGKAKIRNIRSKLKDCCKGLRYQKTFQVIQTLNRILIGWGNFYRFACASKVFSSLDHYLFQDLWRELKRRHPKKGKKWVKKTYFCSRGSNHWILRGTEKETYRERDHYLYQLCQLPIRRHIKFRMKATPFDPDFSKYLKLLTAMKMVGRKREIKRKSKTKSPWKRLFPGQLELFQTGS